MSFNRTSYFSKTAFLKYDQCPKAFFMYKNYPYLRDPVSKEKQFTFNRGHEVGKFAQQLFPGGTDVSLAAKNVQDAALLTQNLIRENITTIYEATFIHNGALIMVDILHLSTGKWNAYEVKSSLKISEVYVKDACLQYYVLKNSLPEFEDLFLVTLNGDYLREETINLHKLFKKRSIKGEGEKNTAFFEHASAEINLLMEKNLIPDIQIGRQCFSPYVCDFFGNCWKNSGGEKSVFNIGKVDKEQLFSWFYGGFDTVEKIGKSDLMKPHLQIQIDCILNGKEFIDYSAIEIFLKKIPNNSCYMDMEVWSPAIPKFTGHKPFEQLPFMFSVTSKKEGQSKSHHHIIPEGTNDLRAFIIALIYSVERFEGIIVYDKNLEMQVLSKMESLFPEFSKEIQEIRRKMIDLSEPVQNFYYYHPKFKGNFSLKAIGEIFSGESNYSNMEVQSGIVAMYKYESLLLEVNPFAKEEIKQQLIEYCNQDTVTCLRFHEYLVQKIRERE